MVANPFQNILTSHIPSKIMEAETVVLPEFLYGYKLWSFILRDGIGVAQMVHQWTMGWTAHV
jgi:hypothetical protein